MKASQPVVRSIGSSPIAAKYADTPFTPYMPLEPLVSAPHLTEHLSISPVTGAFQPSGRPKYEIPLEVDIIAKLNFRIRLQRIGNTAGTYARYINWIGLFCWSEIRIKYGTETLQRIQPEELFVKIQKHYNDEERANLARMLGGDLSPAQRSAKALFGQEIVIPLITCLNLHLYGDQSGSFFVRGLGEKLTIEVDLLDFNKWVEADEAYTAVTVDGTAFSTAGASAVMIEAELYPEGQHIYDNERQRLAKLYGMSRRMVFQEYQYVKNVSLAASLAAGSTSTQDLTELTQPIVAMYAIGRWQEDLDRKTNDNGPSGGKGYNPTNIGKFIFLSNVCLHISNLLLYNLYMFFFCDTQDIIIHIWQLHSRTVCCLQIAYKRYVEFSIRDQYDRSGILYLF